MNKAKILMLCSLASLFLTGCTIKEEVNMKINNDKSMDFSVIVAMDDEMINAMNTSLDEEDEDVEKLTEEQKWEIIDNSLSEESDFNENVFKKVKYEKDGLKGYEYSLKIDNIDDISGENAVTSFDDLNKIEDSVLFKKDGNVYSLNISSPNLSNDSTDISSYGITFDYSFIISLPKEAISHNATNVSEDGKTLSWDLSHATEETKIQVDFSLEEAEKSFNNLIPFIIGIGSIVSIFAIGAFISLRKTKNNKASESINKE